MISSPIWGQIVSHQIHLGLHERPVQTAWPCEPYMALSPDSQHADSACAMQATCPQAFVKP